MYYSGKTNSLILNIKQKYAIIKMSSDDTVISPDKDLITLPHKGQII